MMARGAPEIVDAHVHVWAPTPGRYGWLTPDLAALYRRYTLDDIAPVMDEAGVARIVLVQAEESLTETEEMLAIARTDSRVAGVIGWCDFADPEVGRTLAEYGRIPEMFGVRPMIGDMDDPD